MVSINKGKYVSSGGLIIATGMCHVLTVFSFFENASPSSDIPLSYLTYRR
jgi:hypothetical protein